MDTILGYWNAQLFRRLGELRTYKSVLFEQLEYVFFPDSGILAIAIASDGAKPVVDVGTALDGFVIFPARHIITEGHITGRITFELLVARFNSVCFH